MNNELRKVSVYNSHIQPDPPTRLVDYVAWLKGIVDSIPADLLPSALINNENDELSVDTAIYYFRPETPDEFLAREAAHKQQTEAQEKREREQLEKLKRKYEPEHPKPNEETKS